MSETITVSNPPEPINKFEAALGRIAGILIKRAEQRSPSRPSIAECLTATERQIWDVVVAVQPTLLDDAALSGEDEQALEAAADRETVSALQRDLDELLGW